MTIAVVGANGFVGSALVSLFRESGVPVKPLDRRNSPDLATGQAEDWKPVLDGCEVVVNCAGKAHDLRRPGLAEARDYALVNSLAPKNLAIAARAVGLRRAIHLSTVKVLGSKTTGKPFVESDPLNPQGIYAISKAQGELAFLDALNGVGTEPVVLRIPLVIGTPRKGNLELLEKLICRGVPLPIGHPGIGRRSYARLEELTPFLLTLAQIPTQVPKVLHFRSERDLSVGELASILGKDLGSSARLFSISPAALKSIARVFGRAHVVNKFTDEMLVDDAFSRSAVAITRL